MRNIVRAIPILLIVFSLSLCSSVPPEAAYAPVQTTDFPANGESYIITDHAFKESGEAIPEWMNRYLRGGIPYVEAIPQYTSKYIFIAEGAGTNLKALSQWASIFSPDQDLSLMVSARVQRRLIGAAGGSPDRVFGRYFESTLRLAADTRMTGGTKEGEYWILKQYTTPEAGTDRTEEYIYYILASIEKETLQQQITPLLNRKDIDPAPSKAEKAAIDKMIPIFYDDF